MTRLEDVFAALDSERAYQDSLWQTDGVPNPLTIGEFILSIEEYIAKARAQWIVENKPETQTLHVIRKIAGLGLNACEQHGHLGRRGLYDTFSRRSYVDPSRPKTIGEYILDLEDGIAEARANRSLFYILEVTITAVRCMVEHGAPLR